MAKLEGNNAMFTHVAMILMFGIIVPITMASLDVADKVENDAEAISFERYLTTMGVRLDCYFSLEVQVEREDGSRHLTDRMMRIDPNINSVEALILQLEEIPGVTVIRSPDNPVVLHIVETALSTADAYVMNERMTINHAGSLRDLIEAMEDRLGGRVVRTRVGTSFRQIGDARTQVVLAAADYPARRVLTDFVPLSAYHRILWTAETVETEEGWKTHVFHRGLRRQGVLESLASKSIVPFTDGEIAYVVNPDQPEVHEAAMKFVDTQIRAREPHQVRWAMLYLGKHKVAKAVPLLVRHLDIQYPTAFREEAFPAVLALAEIGDPAVSMALTAIGREEGELRLELLCRVILRAKGGDEGRTLIRENMARIQDVSQRERVAKALRKINEPDTE